MTFQTLYRAGMYVMLTLATLAYSIDSTGDNKLAMLYPPAAAIVGAMALFTVDRKPSLALNRKVGDWLAVGSVLLALLEFSYDRTMLLLALAHWLFYLQTIKSFLVKTIEDDWFLMALGIVQVLVGAVLSQSDAVGIVLFLWSLSALWVLGLFHLNREAVRNSGTIGLSRAESGAGIERAYKGLVGSSFLLRNLAVVLLTMAMGAFFFLLLPRRNASAQFLGPRGAAKHLTGFEETVQLGQLGEILENEEIVMSVELLDQAGRNFRPHSEPLWRGVTLSHYRKGSWNRPPSAIRYAPGSRPDLRSDSDQDALAAVESPPEMASYIRQLITLESSDSRTLFSLCPAVFSTSAYWDKPYFEPRDGTLHRRGPLGVQYRYEVYSTLDDRSREVEGRPMGQYLRELQGRSMDFEPIRTKFEAIAAPIVEGLPKDDLERRARALEKHLRDSGDFHYTLQMGRVDRSLDPTLDFLLNRKRGHCEYFASSLALLLRSVGVPSRVVNGFKGGDWNDLGKVMYVRQKHAHSWVEAYVGDDAKGRPRWIILDPTPAYERTAAVPTSGGLGEAFRQAADFFRWVWSTWVVGFDSDRQNRLIYTPFKWVLSESRDGFLIMWAALKSLLSGRVKVRQLSNIFSFGGFVVSFTILLLLVFLVRAASWALKRLAQALKGPDGEDPSLAAGILFYKRLTKALSQRGYDRSSSETPGEFARRAASELHADEPAVRNCSGVPSQVVEAYYRVRYGGLELGETELASLTAGLEQLELALAPAKA